MEYITEVALDVIEKFNLNPSTLKVWKTRGKIPDRYFNEHFQLRRLPQTMQEKADYERGIQVFSNNKINTTVLLSKCGIDKNSYFDAIRKADSVVMLDFNSFIRLKKELNSYRIKVKALIDKLATRNYYSDLDKTSIDEILDSDIIVHAPLFGYDNHTPRTGNIYTAYARFLARKRKIIIIHEDWEVKYMLDRLSIFLLETSM